MKFQSEFKHFHSRKCTLKTRLRNGIHFVSASMCLRLPVASFAGEVGPRLAKRPLKTNVRLANRELASLVREATGSNNAQRASTITLIIVRIVCGVC